MGKIKMNLPTGTNVEKTLINCFKVDDNIYVVFDAENVGSMGLPIILISKMVNNRLIKIVDADEWAKVKGYLKEIISGVSKKYVALQENLDADELFYNQLTLPVASFDALKNAYKIENVTSNELPLLTENNVEENASVESLEQSVEEIQKPLEMQSDNDNFVSVNEGEIIPEASVAPNENVEKQETNLNEISLPVLEDNSNIPNAGNGNITEKEDAVANPLIDDAALPVLDLPVVDSIDNSLENSSDVSMVEQTIIQNVESTVDGTTPSIELSAEKVNSNYDLEKEEFLKYCSEFFDKMIEKIKNN